jgi:hypothetical protein
MTGPLAAAMTGPMLAVKGAAALVTPKENEPLRIRVLRITTILVIIVAAIASGVYLLTNSGGNGLANSGATSPASPKPTVAAKTTAPKTKATPKATAKSKAKSSTHAGKGATAGYLLSTPATAGGYPQGQDPHFLATATTTAQSIVSTVTSGGGGAVTGSPVSAAYKLPTNSQVITFVGYKGTFNPAKVITSMSSFGTTDKTYPGGTNGGEIACANTPATASSPSGGVCVWATATTLGVTQFFDIAGPETLTVSQYRGAADTEKLRSSVEAKK